LHYLAKEIWQRSSRMEQSLHWSWFKPQETKYSSENKVGLVFKHFTFCSIFVSLLFLIYFNCKLFCWSLIYFCKFVSKIIIFQKALQFRASIVLCYSRQTVVKITGCVPPPFNLAHISNNCWCFVFICKCLCVEPISWALVTF